MEQVHRQKKQRHADTGHGLTWEIVISENLQDTDVFDEEPVHPVN
jgi:hypothetical protein